MQTVERVIELANERNLTLHSLAQLCDISYSTVKSAKQRGTQLGIDTIERICDGLGIDLADFFAADTHGGGNNRGS